MLYVHNRSECVQPYDEKLSSQIWGAFFNDGGSAEQIVSARQALMDLHKNRLWLACDCQGTAGPMPMIGPRDGRGGMHPFRFGEVRHAEGCPFAAEIRSPSSVDDEDDINGPITGPWLLDHLVHPGQSEEKFAFGLDRLLRTALHQLGYERLHVSSFDPKSPRGKVSLLETPFMRLRQLGTQDMGNGVHFSQVGSTFLPAITRTYGSLRKVASEHPERPTVGLFIGVIESADQAAAGHPGVLTARDQKGARRSVPVHGRIRAPAGDHGAAGPYWALGLITEHAPSGQFRLSDATLIHALDRRTLLPIPDATYRPVGQLLLEQLVFWSQWKKLKADVEMRAPLFVDQDPDLRGLQLVLPAGQCVQVVIDQSADVPVPGDATVHLKSDTPMDESMRRRLTGAIASAQRRPSA